MKTIKDVNNIKLITPLRVNSKTTNVINNFNKSLLKERYKIEHFFSLLKRL
jgi:hypothetical protein